MQRVFSFEIRLEAVRLHEEEDLSPGAIAKKIGTVHSVVERWLKLYKYNGIEGLKIKDYNQQYDDDLKSKVIEQVTVQNIPYILQGPPGKSSPPLLPPSWNIILPALWTAPYRPYDPVRPG